MSETPKCDSCKYENILLLYGKCERGCVYENNIYRKIYSKEARPSPKWCPLRKGNQSEIPWEEDND